MAFVNLKKKEVQVKIVYYGPGRGGKTTNLEYIYNEFNDRIKTEMIPRVIEPFFLTSSRSKWARSKGTM